MNTGTHRPQPDAQHHRALASPVRRNLLQALRDQPDLDAATLAKRIQLHVNTIRTHLGVLEQAGLITPSTEDRDRPGRPRHLYRLTEDGRTSLSGPNDHGYQFLATVLASHLGAVSDDTEATAEQAGAAWGRFMINGPEPFTDLAPADAIKRLVALLDNLGFDPQMHDQDPAAPEILLRTCPFLDVAREHPQVVCSIHLGLMRGALDHLGVDVRADDLIPWAREDGCVTHLAIDAG